MRASATPENKPTTQKQENNIKLWRSLLLAYSAIPPKTETETSEVGRVRSPTLPNREVVFVFVCGCVPAFDGSADARSTFHGKSAPPPSPSLSLFGFRGCPRVSRDVYLGFL